MGSLFDTVSSTSIGNLIEVHGKDFVFGKVKLSEDGEDEFFDLSGEGFFWGEESVFDELLGDSGATLERILLKVGLESANDTAKGKA